MNHEFGRFQTAMDTDDEGQWKKLFFGDQSVIAEGIRNIGDDPSSRLNELNALVQSEDDFRRRLGCCDDEIWNENLCIMLGLIKSLEAAIALIDAKGTKFSDVSWENNLRQKLETAINSFHNAWSRDQNSNRTILNDSKRFSWIDSNDDVEKAFGLLTGDQSALGYWVVRDLLERWVTQRKNPGKVISSRSMTTPILGADKGGNGAEVLNLTVELFPCEQGVFCPDPMFLGLTSIMHSDLTLDLCQAMHDVWVRSGLSPWFRGRWRITTPDSVAAVPLEIKQYYGRSLQAATLCALLAACGDPYRENDKGEIRNTQPTAEPEPLASNIAISATLGPGGSNEPLSKMILGKVGYIPAKLMEASKFLDTVLLSEEDCQRSVEATDLINKKDEAQKKRSPYNGLDVETVRTLGQAFDVMLVRNRYLRAYQAAIRDEWLRGWQKGTARFEGDDAPGPDDANVYEMPIGDRDLAETND